MGEGTGQEQTTFGIDPNAYRAGRWYRFLNAKGDCHVYVHNYTRDITATRPENFTELTEHEKKRLEKLGTFILDLPSEIQRVYDKEKAIPIIFGSEDTCEALKQFFLYDKDGQLLDATKLNRVNAKALEESRQAIVNAMTLGKTLCIFLGDSIPELQEKICIPKNRDSFPRAVFAYDGLGEGAREKFYRDADREAGMCVVRDGFRVCVVLMYDGMNLDMSSMRKAELPQKIPEFEQMREVRVYSEADKKKALEQMRGV